MKIPMTCSQCEMEAKKQGVTHKKDLYFDMQNVNDSGVYEYECPSGHKNIASLQNWKYEVLFEMGVNAYLDEYYREAVVNFATALERFYEYSILVFCYYSNISKEEIDKMWKDVSNQSERQLGAYCFLYLQSLKRNPEIFKDKVVNFRNKVVHKGYIPSREECFNYGKKVAEYIQHNLNLYNDTLGEKLLERVQIDYLVDKSGLPHPVHQMGFMPTLLMDFEAVIAKGEKRIK